MSFTAINTTKAAAKQASVLDLGIGLGTPVLTMEGELPVEFLSPGDRIITRSGARRLIEVEVTVVENARVVRISQETLGKDRPTLDLIVAPNQPILLRDWRAKAMFGRETAMVAAARLTDGEYIRAEVLAQARIYTLRFEDDVVIYAAGLEMSCAAVKVSA